jgi:hypothetical protein
MIKAAGASVNQQLYVLINRICRLQPFAGVNQHLYVEITSLRRLQSRKHEHPVHQHVNAKLTSSRMIQ